MSATMDRDADAKHGSQTRVDGKLQTFSVFKDPTEHIRGQRKAVNSSDASDVTIETRYGLADDDESFHELATLLESKDQNSSALSKAYSSRSSRPVLGENALKVNSSSKSGSNRGRNVPGQNVHFSPHKRRIDDQESEHPCKSPKLRHSVSDNASTALELGNGSQKVIIGLHGEPPPSGIPSRPSKFQEGSMNNKVGREPPSTMIESKLTIADAMEIDVDSPDDSFITFNAGIIETPRTSAVSNFGSVMRTWNPFKAVGGLIGRVSKTSSPAQAHSNTLTSKQVTRQVEEQLQQFENRILEKVLALQASQNQSVIEVDRTPIAVTKGIVACSATETEDNLPLTNDSSLDLDISMSEDINVHPAHFIQCTEVGKTKSSRNPFATLLRSPIKGRSLVRGTVSLPLEKRNTDLSKLFARPESDQSKMSSISLANNVNSGNLNDDHTKTNNGASTTKFPTAATQTGVPQGLEDMDCIPPRLKTKASQHLKKMASRMNLRTRKSKNEDFTLAKNHEYRVMKKKNKDEILKDYLVLQKEKQELEKRLAEDSAVKVQADVQADNTLDLNSPLGQTQQCTDQAECLPSLEQTNIPNLSNLQHKNSSLDMINEEQNPVKRSFSTVPLPLSSNSSAIKLFQDGPPASDKILPNGTLGTTIKEQEQTFDLNESIMEEPEESDLVSSPQAHPPVPQLPAKYRSKVPKPARRSGNQNIKKKTEEWSGWDEEVF